MKLFGLHRIDGGITIATSSGKETLVALPDDRLQAARLVGQRLLDMLDDPAEPHESTGKAPDARTDLEDGLRALGEGIETTREVWHALRLLTRRGGR